MKTPLAAVSTALLMLTVPAWAKLPPLSDEAKAKAAEAAAKAAHTGKVDAFKLCKSMDQVAATYFDRAKQASKTVPAAVQTAACADPGPFVYAPAGATPAAPAAPGVAAANPAAATTAVAAAKNAAGAPNPPATPAAPKK